jgi:DNA-binding HxlR family transcriptional regulator
MEDCTIYKAMDLVGKKWTLVIILELHKGTKRFNELKSKIPEITAKILSARLKELEEEGLVKKEIDNSCIPIRCDYSLTKSGHEFMKIIIDLKSWALKWKFDNKICQAMICKNCNI